MEESTSYFCLLKYNFLELLSNIYRFSHYFYFLKSRIFGMYFYFFHYDIFYLPIMCVKLNVLHNVMYAVLFEYCYLFSTIIW